MSRRRCCLPQKISTVYKMSGQGYTNTKQTIAKCRKCNLTLLKTKRKKRFLAKVLFEDGKSIRTLLLLDDKLEKLFKIYKEQNTCPTEFHALDDNLLMEILLTVKAKVVFNTENNSFNRTTFRKCITLREQYIPLSSEFYWVSNKHFLLLGI